MVHPLEAALRRHVSGAVRFDAAARALYSTDASNYQVYPLGVVMPRTVDDVIAAVALCAEHGISVIPRGGGSNLCGSAIGAGVVLDFTPHMDAILDLDIAARQVRVQPGVILGRLNRQLAAHGLQFGPDPASAERVSVGGAIGANATGAHSIRHGMTADHVDAVQVVLADGTLTTFDADQSPPLLRAAVEQIARAHEVAIRRDFPKVWRRASGYNLDYVVEMLSFDSTRPPACLTEANARRRGSNLEAHLRQIGRRTLAPLFAGAEGTLGVITEATLHVVPKPRHTALVVAAFASLEDAMRAVPLLLTADPSAIELIGGVFIRTARELPECRERLSWLDARDVPDGVLVIEFDGDTPTEVADRAERLHRLARTEQLPCHLRTLLDAQAQADVWHVRRIGLNVLTSIRGHIKPISIVEDLAVPVERLAEFVARMDAIFAANDTYGAYYAHASAGVLHVRPMVNLRTARGLEQMRTIGQQALALCHELGGAMSGEHGDGLERSHYNEALFGPQVYQAFCALKDTFDPCGLLNPGKKVRASEMEAHLRFGPNYRAAPYLRPTTFRFREDGSFAAMAEQCNGNGACRKLDSGVMCPSYRATRDEAHSTRGRANLLRELLRENAPIHLDLEAVKRALELCLSCKACATECVAGVDMSKLKSEFLAHYYARHGIPLRAWLLGRIGRLAPLASALAPLSNTLLRTRLVKAAFQLAPERRLPAFHFHSFDRWWRYHPQPNDDRPQVVLFVDTFARYQHPQVALDAVRLLEHLGYRVIVPPWRCCGRPLISQGQPAAMLEDARFNVAQLYHWARQGIPIIGLEPSCVSALRNDYPDLLDGDEVRIVAQYTMSIEAWLAQRLPDAPSASDAPLVLLHGHCHQKALWGTSTTHIALRKVGFRVEEIDSTCCGMAGAFGYEAEHYSLSQRIGELSLLPAVRAAPPNAVIAAPGTSCREQIAHFTTRVAYHPVELIARRVLRQSTTAT